jgi:4-hydroxy-tetrahydrodipicolinate synthase
MDLAGYRRVLRGISGVHATAYDAQGEIDPALTAKIVSRIADAGVHNIVSGGNTGEFYSLTEDEVIRLQAIAIEAVAGKAAVTAAAGRSVREAIKVAKAAGSAGADGVMIHHPRLQKRLNCPSSPISVLI